jgi:AbiV family abortive infection protein
MAPIIMPIDHAREGCEKIALNVIELARGASHLMNTDDGNGYTRQAYALVIHAIDETGKMINIIKEMMTAESNASKAIRVVGFYSHSHKGSEAAAIGLVAVDWFSNLLETVAAGLEEDEDEDSMDRYKLHLRTLRDGFEEERGRVLYVDYENGTWLQPTSARDVDIVLDGLLLSLTAVIVADCMKKEKTFHEVYDEIQKVRDSVAAFFRGDGGTTLGRRPSDGLV